VVFDVGSLKAGVWERVKGEMWDGFGLWWRWPAWKGVLKRISATVMAGLSIGAPLGPVVGIGIRCLHLRLRPLTLVENVQVPFQGEVKV
jgi:hypothetical protein